MKNKIQITAVVVISLVLGACVYFSECEPINLIYEDNTYICDIHNPDSKPWYKEKININIADKDLLITIPGIGEKRAEDIIAYREENGGFQTTEDIMKIKGIGEKTFESIKDFICT